MNPSARAPTNARVRRLVSRLHATLRDGDGRSSLLERFDELTKLLFLKAMTERDGSHAFVLRPGEATSDYLERLRERYRAYAQALPALVPKTFSTLTLSDEALRRSSQLLLEVQLEAAPFDVRGLAYEEVIRGTFDKSDHQQFFTPPELVRFTIALLRPFLSGSIGDPACGTGGFLAEVLRAQISHESLLGLEVDERLAWVAGVNLLLFDAKRFSVRALESGGSLGSGAMAHANSLDAIITNPPFGSEVTDPAILNTFVLGRDRPSRRRGILFLERCWSLLRPGGVLGIILDEGVLSQPSSRDVRAFLLERFELLAVIALPESAFMPYATVTTSLLVLRKAERPPPPHAVFFARAEHVGRKPNGDDDLVFDSLGQAHLRSDLSTILEAWANYRSNRPHEVDGLAYSANVAATLASDPTLRLDARYHHPARQRALELFRDGGVWRTLSELCSERNELFSPSDSFAEPMILFTGLADIEPNTGVARQVPTPSASLKSPVRRYEPGDIVFARLRPGLRKVALMRFEEGGFVSAECVVLTVKRNEDGVPLLLPELVAALLRSDLVHGQLGHLILGIGRPRVSINDLRKVELPVPDQRAQREALSALTEAHEASRNRKAQARELMAEAERMERESVEHVARALAGVPSRER